MVVGQYQWEKSSILDNILIGRKCQDMSKISV